jgi:hypothetical protein
MGERNVTIGQDALGNAIVTGDNNLTFVLFGVGADHIPAKVLEALKSGRLADEPGVVPLPALTLAIDFTDEDRTQWRITASVSRTEAVPWQSDAAFAPAFETFWRLSRTPAQKAEDAERLDAAAHRLGEALADDADAHPGGAVIGSIR